jgi:hypothetical protein
MFLAIDPEFLLARRLRGGEQTAHAGQECRIVSLRAAPNGGEMVEIAPFRADGTPASQHAKELTLWEAAQWYRVNRESDIVSLAEDLESRCARLFKNWPCRGRGRSSEGELVLAALLSSTCPRDDWPQHLKSWCEDARGFLRLEACLSETPPGRTAAEFFQQLADKLNADRQRWTEEVTIPRPLAFSCNLTPVPKPVSLLTELQRGVTMDHCHPTAAIRRRSYLEGTLEGHWTRICDETSLLKDLLGEAVSVFRVEARIADSAEETRDPRVATVEIRFKRREFVIQVDLPFRARATDDRELETLSAEFSLYGRRPARIPTRVPARFESRLRLHLNDMQWALDRY